MKKHKATPIVFRQLRAIGGWCSALDIAKRLNGRMGIALVRTCLHVMRADGRAIQRVEPIGGYVKWRVNDGDGADVASD